MINATRLESWFWRDVQSLTASPDLVTSWLSSTLLAAPTDVTAELRSIEAELARMEHRRQVAWELTLDATPEMRLDLPKQLRKISEREAILRDHVNELKSAAEQTANCKRSTERAQELVKELPTLYSSADYHQKRELCNAVVGALGGAVATKTELIWNRIKS